MKRLLPILALLLVLPLHAGRSFNGSTDVATISAVGNGLDISSGPMTVSLWVYPTAVTSAEQDIVGKWGSGAANQQWVIAIGNPGWCSAKQFGASVGPPYNLTGVDTCIAGPVGANAWYQVVLAVDPAGKYTGGGGATNLVVVSKSGTGTGSGGTGWRENRTAGGVNMTVGGSSIASTNIAGIVAEVAVWNDILSPAERLALESVCPLGIRRTAMVGYFPLWGASGSSTEPDQSGNKHNATLTGTTAANHPPCAPRMR